MGVPFIGRLYIQEYVALILSFFFIFTERFLRAVTLVLPTFLINFLYLKSRTLFNSFSSREHTNVDSDAQEKDVVAKVRDADGFVELVELWGEEMFRIEEHVVQTTDGYLLGLHRIFKKTPKEDEERRRKGSISSINGAGNGDRKVVYLHHGLLMNSEVWVCQLDKKDSLPWVLADKGFDVWLGNNRGNKYSKKSIHHASTSTKFWDFSIDDFAFYDIPDSISYILETTKQKSLSYIGFSQGTAQAFATLSIHPKLNEQIDVFIALAPAMNPSGLYAGMADALMKASPNLMYLFFGRKSILSSTTFWQSILYPPIFVRVIDTSLTALFNWRGANITLPQKLASYAHLYSYTSVKSVVHWFQIMRNGCFQMYDDDIQTPTTSLLSTGRNFYKVARFPTKNITTPIALVYGGSDSLVDINVMLKELPAHTVAKGIPHYEHLDMLWGRDVRELVFPHVFDALEQYSKPVQAGVEHIEIRPLAGEGRYALNLDLDIDLPESSPDPEHEAQRQKDKEIEDEIEAAVQKRLLAATPRQPPRHVNRRKARRKHSLVSSTGTYTSTESNEPSDDEKDQHTSLTTGIPKRTSFIPSQSQSHTRTSSTTSLRPATATAIDPPSSTTNQRPDSRPRSQTDTTGENMIYAPNPRSIPFSPSLRVDTPPPGDAEAPAGFHFEPSPPHMARRQISIRSVGELKKADSTAASLSDLEDSSDRGVGPEPKMVGTSATQEDQQRMVLERVNSGGAGVIEGERPGLVNRRSGSFGRGGVGSVRARGGGWLHSRPVTGDGREGVEGKKEDW